MYEPNYQIYFLSFQSKTILHVRIFKIILRCKEILITENKLKKQTCLTHIFKYFLFNNFVY